MKTDRSTTEALRALRALARYETHGGYVWAAVISDGELVCVPCVRAEYRQIFRATSDPSDHSGWRVVGTVNSGDSEQTETCAHCNKVIWEYDEPVDWACGYSGRLTLKIKPSDAASASHSGRCDDDVAELRRVPYIAEQLAEWSPEDLRRELKECGAWDTAQLADNGENIARMLWIACCDVRDGNC